MSSITGLNDLSDDVLHLVVKYGNIEDVVMKERISKRFKNCVSNRLSKMKRINTETNFFKCDDRHDKLVLNLLRRMKNLVDGTEFGSWDDEMIKELATFNHSIVNWSTDYKDIWYDYTEILLYIEAVKKIDSKYDASRLTYGFYDDDYGKFNEIRDLYTDYPDLNLKLNLDSDCFPIYSNYERNHCFRLLIALQNSLETVSQYGFSYSNVQEVSIRHEQGMTCDMTIFPNLNVLGIGASDELNLKDWRIPPKLTILAISPSAPWNAADNVPLKQIINNYPLIELYVYAPNNSLLILNLVIESPRSTIQNVKLDQLSILHDDIEFYNEFIDGEVIKPFPFIGRDLFKRMLIRFKKVITIKLPKEWMENVEYTDTMKEVCLEVENLCRRRSFKFVISEPDPLYQDQLDYLRSK